MIQSSLIEFVISLSIIEDFDTNNDSILIVLIYRNDAVYLNLSNHDSANREMEGGLLGYTPFISLPGFEG